jgi:hypothetical protein
MPAKTGAQREAKRRTQGRAIACVIRDRDALSALAALERKHGGVTAAITAVLIHASIPHASATTAGT